jgi:hypothetical protein
MDADVITIECLRSQMDLLDALLDFIQTKSVQAYTIFTSPRKGARKRTLSIDNFGHGTNN